MKLVFNKSPNGLELAYVECVSTTEADDFQNWFYKQLNKGESQNETQEKLPLETKEETKNVPKSLPQKVTRNDVSQAAIALVQTKGREALNPILTKFKAKRISEIPEEQLALAYADISEGM
jgi:hypothetical protein